MTREQEEKDNKLITFNNHLIKYEFNDFVLKFEIFKNYHGYLYGEDGSVVENIDEAECMCSGTVRYDGCINLNYNHIHHCNYEEIFDFNSAINNVYKLAEKTINYFIPE